MRTKQEFKDLQEDIQRNGILDPILVNQYPDRLQVETGGQRLLLARSFNIPYLKAFIYPKKNAKIVVKGLKISNMEEIKSQFRSLEIATYLDIEGYIKSGHIQLETDS
ncbi:MAG: ParB N-terminal domain-containing protein [Candidatus Cloacimonetes bacterium]|nr:ParB N-terminal domain-containing protein [Candidatus Cloacimonadota bacterium]